MSPNLNSNQPATVKRGHAIIVGAGAYENKKDLYLEYIRAAQEIHNSISGYIFCLEPYIYHKADTFRVDFDFERNIEKVHTVFIFISGYHHEGSIRLFGVGDFYPIEKFLEKVGVFLKKGINTVLFLDIADFDKDNLHQFLGYRNFAFISRAGRIEDTPQNLYPNLKRFITGSNTIYADSFCEFFQSITPGFFYVKPSKDNFVLFSKLD